MQFQISNVKNKKYSTISPKGKTIHFGDTRYEHYFDKIGHYSDMNHLNEVRRNNYLKRAMNIKNKDGEYTWNNAEYANYYSVHYLW
jgi:hypothetical protein